jgi:hypothetical protein
MILRRIIAHFRKQEWTAIGIDFLIVVLGVFVATQVSDWSAREADERRGEAYAQRLIGDVQGDLRSRRIIVGYYDAVTEAAVQTNALLQQSSPDPRELVINAYRASEYISRASMRATWDEIVSSGDLGLLPDTALAPLADYFRADLVLEASDTFRDSAYRQRVRRLISYEVQNAIRTGCGDRLSPTGAMVGFREDCVLNGLTEAQIADSAQALRRDPLVLEYLRYQISDLSASQGNLGRDIAALEAALAALESAD